MMLNLPSKDIPSQSSKIPKKLESNNLIIKKNTSLHSFKGEFQTETRVNFPDDFSLYFIFQFFG